MSVMLMRAVAVLDKPKFKLPSMSVAWTMMVYWDTFCKEAEKEKNILRDWCFKCKKPEHRNQSTNTYFCHVKMT